jgi:MATE family multidrug resistance protein
MQQMNNRIRQRWRGPGGVKEIMVIAVPLIMSTGAHGLRMFTDRAFLMWYDTNAISSAMMAGMAAFTIISLFQGTIAYVNTFVAQYTGAARHHRIGHAVWQGVFMAVLAGIIMLLFIIPARRFFQLIGHNPRIQVFEITYFRIMCIGAAPAMVSIALSSFFTGRGKTKLVMWITLTSTALNVILDYAMIFGKFGFPEMGVAGAAWATAISAACGTMMFLYFFLRPEYREKYSTLTGARPDFQLFARIIRFGLPNGIQFMLEMTCWTIFLALAGKISETAFNASAMTMQIHSLSFMPMIGCAIATSILVGQRIGSSQPDIAERSAWSSVITASTYMSLLAIGYVIVPRLFMLPFSSGANAADFAVIAPVSIVLLRFVALHNLFGGANMMLSSSLKGAGDTRYVMAVSTSMCWLIVAVPSLIAVRFFNPRVYVLWIFTTTFVIVMCAILLKRFLQGKWKSMKVIETPAPSIPLNTPNVPATEIEAP